jgi:CubicO group peptidase (beta-lactamase class C family)
MFPRTLALVVCAVALCGLAAAPGPAGPDLRARVDEVFKEYDRSDSPGCALGVYRDGAIVLARGYGMANLELGVANSPQTVFDIGSTSKQFTAFSIHLLAREGKLSLDDDVRRWVPEVPDYGRTITIRNLLHHTGGLRDYIELMNLQGVQTEDLTTDQDALAMISRQKAPNFAPGEEHLYSNTGYFLLSVVVRRASGRSLRDFAAERIFGPLGMRHTQYNDAHARIIPGRATGYRKAEGGGFEIDMSDWEQTGDGAIQTSVEDLLRWDQNFYDPHVGDRDLVAAMQVPGELKSGKKLTYASALVVSSYRGLRTVSHGGSWAGYRAQLMRFPEQRFSVACLCNLGNANPTALAQKVAEVYLGDLMKPAPSPSRESAPGAAAAAVSRERLARLAGGYRDPAEGTVLTLSTADGKLHANLGGTRFSLAPAAGSRFVSEDPSRGRWWIDVEATPPAGRPRLRLQREGEEEAALFEPFEQWTPSRDRLAEFAGEYASAELDTTWRLAADAGRLYVRHRGFPAEPLQPTVRDTFSIEGTQLSFERSAGGAITGFQLGVGRAKGVEFKKQSD